MIVNGCIKIYPRGYKGWITVLGLRVLLITHYLIREILMDVVLDVYTRDITKNNYQSRYYNDVSSTQKKIFMEKYICWYAHSKNDG